MEPLALYLMLSVWTVVVLVLGYCFFKIMVSKKAFGLDDETPDHMLETPPGDFLSDPEHAEKYREGDPPRDDFGTNDSDADKFRQGDPP